MTHLYIYIYIYIYPFMKYKSNTPLELIETEQSIEINHYLGIG